MKLLLAVLASLVALSFSQVVTPRDPYQDVVYDVISEDTGLVCATYTIAGQFIVPYFNMSGSGGVINVEVNLPMIPNNGTTTGDLGNSICPFNQSGVWRSVLVASFSNGEIFTMAMEGQGATIMNGPTSWNVVNIEFTYDEADSYYFPDNNGSSVRTVNISDPASLNIGGGQDEYYSCSAPSSANMVGNGPTIPFNFRDLRLNPFNVPESGKEMVCDADKSSNKVVPIAVGASLGGLLLLVILAYFLGKKMRSGGYQKV